MAFRVPIEVHPTHVRNILDTISRADSATVESGMRWYSDWSEYLYRVAVQNNVRFDTAVSIFSCLSANKSLTGNLRMFGQYFTTGVDSIREATGSQRDKVRALALSEAPLTLLTSNKVGSFAANLAGSLDRVTIDRHAAQCAHDDRGVDKVPNRLYHVLQLAYQQAATMVGIESRQAQAIAWVQWRSEKPNMRGTTLAGDPDIGALLQAFNAVDVETERESQLAYALQHGDD